VDNSSISTLAQRMGSGGYDYGSAISDLNLEDIQSVRLLRGPAAAMLYGGRAANGVFIVTTRNARGLSGFDISASQQASFEKPLRLPEYQNLYGQGLGGLFAFFDGKGGGINDSVSQSWGPAFVGQPLPQASITEAGRADVRPWVAQPNNVADYYDRGRTLATNVAAQGANETGQFRLSLANRSTNGITPEASLSRQSATLAAGLRPSTRLNLDGTLQLYRDKAEDRPGSGFDESNPVSVFSMMGRQVDVPALRDHLRDAAGNQISWNYAGHNNPYFAALANDQHDERSRILGGASATYAFNSWLQGSARAGADHYSDTRSFDVAAGWMGGFPYYLGRGNFATGGFERDDIDATQTNIEASLRATPAAASAGAFAFTLGVGRRSNSLNAKSTGSDKLPDAGTTAPLEVIAQSHTLFVQGGAQATLHDYATLDVSVRHESSSLESGSGSELYPAVLASIDLARANPALRHGTLLDALVLRAGWSRSGNDATPALLYGAVQRAPALTYEQLAAPEITSGFELGANASLLDRRLSLDLAYYNERSENLLVPTATAVEFLRTGEITNSGIEAQAELVPYRHGDAFEWRVGGNFARNTNNVESLGAGVSSVLLTNVIGGVSVQAREGSPLGAIVGMAFLRDASGALLLRDGHPLPDSVTGPVVLATSAPDWTGGVSSGLKIWGLDLSVLFDIRRGGQIYSASNRAGAYAGNLAETSFRPDSGLLIEGIDVATGKANAVHVTTENYYHALGAIGERWLYDASFVKLREARATIDLPLHALGLHAQRFRLSLIGRNLALWTNVPNIDPETALSTSVFRGAELGQLPSTRSVGVQFTLTP
jgi:TonB-dependent SusC/RagA subfamily outer membrane receptor